MIKPVSIVLLTAAVAFSSLTAGRAREEGAPDLARGAQLFGQCAVCHALSENDAHRAGPNLYGVFGSVAGAKPGFAYSNALEQADFIWTQARLDEWLADPRGYLPGNRMFVAPIAEADQRRDLIAYIESQTSADSDTP